MKILKFGGKALANGEGINRVISIIEAQVDIKQPIVIVVSARGNSTNELEEMLEKAVNRESYIVQFEAFKNYQEATICDVDFLLEFETLLKIFEGVKLLGDYSSRNKDEVLAQGELLSVKLIAAILNKKGIKANAVDARALIKTDNVFGNAQPNMEVSEHNVQEYFKQHNANTVNIVTGFIASNSVNKTTTLGRNGSNYTASLLANFLNAEELLNYTHVNGIYTANPDVVPDAIKIKELSFAEANELANFGTTILHAKTIIPLLEKEIPLRILNVFNPKDKGTLITANSSTKEIKALSVLEHTALVNIEGRGLLGKVGVDARIFSALSSSNISVSIVSQGSSERGVGLIIDKFDAKKAVIALEKEFEKDLYLQDISVISVITDVSVISVVGQSLKSFHKPFNALIKNQIEPLLINNSVSAENVSLVILKSQLNKALNILHGEIFGMSKKVNLAIFGHGNVGSALIDQLLDSANTIEKRKAIKLNVFAIANSTKVLLDKDGIQQNWNSDLTNNGQSYQLKDIYDYANTHHLENLITIDNTSSLAFVSHYIDLVEHGFDLVSSNKIANTIGQGFYNKLRNALTKNQKSYLYETNVGAGLPLIDTIKLLHHSGEHITRIRGVFSGSLSYIFNRFSQENVLFSTVLQDALYQGFTEPNPREDLSGKDVARKLLILARELDLHNELTDVEVDNLIPNHLREIETAEFLKSFGDLNEKFLPIKANQKSDYVLRYIGDLCGDLSQANKAILKVKLVSVPKASSIGALKGADSIFEIYTKSYGDHPIVIQGAGAGSEVTARGVFGDVLRLINKNN